MAVQTHRVRWGDILFCAAVFLMMLLFFTLFHPIPIMDEDDVIYSVLVRKAIPIPGGWNPARMAPEIMTAMCGHVAAICASLGLGRFIDCQVFLLGLMLSGFITVYVYSMMRLLEKHSGSGRFTAVCLSLLFLLFHFLIFRVSPSRNLYMFHSYDACCICYYTIPALLNCTLVMAFMTVQEGVSILDGKNLLRASCWILVLYFAIFSNLFGSIILAAYAGFRLVKDLAVFKKTRKPWKHFIIGNALWFSIVVLWLLALILEATGGRAGVSSGQNSAFLLRLSETITRFVSLLKGSNLLFKLILAAALSSAAALVFMSSDQRNKCFLKTVAGIILWGLVTLIFIILLCTAVEPTYIERAGVIFPAIFAVFLIMTLCMEYVVSRIPRLAVLLPIALIFVSSMTNTRFLTFLDSNPLLLDGHLAVRVENDIYESIIAAAKAGKTEVTVRVPKSNEPANWPHDGLIGDPIAQLFLKYGIIDHEIKVWTEPSEEFNREFHINLAESE